MASSVAPGEPECAVTFSPCRCAVSVTAATSSFVMCDAAMSPCVSAMPPEMAILIHSAPSYARRRTARRNASGEVEPLLARVPAVAAGDVERLAGGEHARSDGLAALDGASQRVVSTLRLAGGPRGRDATHERQAGVGGHPQRQRGFRFVGELGALPSRQHQPVVGVHVHQARHDPLAGGANHLGAGGHRRGRRRTDGFDAIALDDHHRVGDRRTARSDRRPTRRRSPRRAAPPAPARARARPAGGATAARRDRRSSQAPYLCSHVSLHAIPSIDANRRAQPRSSRSFRHLPGPSCSAEGLVLRSAPSRRSAPRAAARTR